MYWAALALALVGAGSAVYQGEQTRKAASKAERSQRRAQRQTLLASVEEERRATMAERKANARKPDLSSILFQERAAADAGPGSTILAGRHGGSGGLLGSKSTLLGS